MSSRFMVAIILSGRFGSAERLARSADSILPTRSQASKFTASNHRRFSVSSRRIYTPFLSDGALSDRLNYQATLSSDHDIPGS
ncbi:MAG: hypothetical protein WCP55_08700 [Lentisphaerota bacterium]